MSTSTQNLTFNILTFAHPFDELTLLFYNKELEGLNRIHKSLVPTEVIEQFGEQEHYYTSFDKPLDEFLPVTKSLTPTYIESSKKDGKPTRTKVENSCFGFSILKRFYTYKIHTYFIDNGYIVKPNFVDDIEVWLPSSVSQDKDYHYFDKYTLKIQIARITSNPELLLSFDGTSKVFKKSIASFHQQIAPEYFNWVMYNDKLFKFDELPEEARRNYNTVFPVWNFNIRIALNQGVEAPERGNKYLKYKEHIEYFYANHICKDNFRSIIPINCDSFIKVDELKVSKVSFNSNNLLFGGKHKEISPIKGMPSHGPLEISPWSKIHLFFILHKDDTDKAIKIDSYFKGNEDDFKGLLEYVKLGCYVERGFSIVFNNKENPLPEIEESIHKRDFKPDIRYIAIYISPYSKNINDEHRKSIYYKVKELLLKYNITSQVLDADKINNPKVKYKYSLPNIAIAMLAKLGGTPWRLDTQSKNELIVGVGAFKHIDTNIQYIGSAFSFQNNGKFNRFECFRKNEIDELAGSILRSVKEYAIHFKNLSRLIIHFYKNMSQDELEPIEKGLKTLGLDIPVFIVSINKTESRDIVAFDESYLQQIPLSGTYINIGFNRYLLFNNTRYSNYPMRETEGFPFPVKLSITCTDRDLEKDPKVIQELIDQVYQFSRLYWKSLSQQNLPVTIKYPEMVAEMFPHFDGYEIPDFGKDNLWFL